MSFNEWTQYKLGSICEKIGSGATPRGGKEAYLDSGEYALVRSQNVLDFTFSYNGLAFIDESQASKLNNVTLEDDDVLLNITGDSVARVCQIPNDILPARVNQHVAIIRPNKEILSNVFLKYYLLNPSFKAYLLNLSAVGATRNALTKGMIEDLDISIPSLDTQNQIAIILASLDKKIENNLQTNRTLDVIGQILFKELCVPKENIVPEGWRKIKLNQLIRIKHGYAFKGAFFSNEETQDILITPGNFRIGGGFNYSKFKYYCGDFPEEYILSENDLVVTMTDLSKEGDTLGYSALIPTISGKKILHNQRVGKVEFKEEGNLKFFLYFLMREREYRNFVLGSATGTTVRHTSPDRICDFDIILPTDHSLIVFSENIKPILDKIQQNQQEIQTLTVLRDALLPKLMSGEIEVYV